MNHLRLKTFFTNSITGAIILVGLLIPFSAQAAATSTRTDSCTTATLSLINTKTGQVSSTNTIKASQSGNYALRVNIKTNIGCSLGTYSLLYSLYNDSNGTHTTPVEQGYFAQDFKVDNNNYQRDSVALGAAKQTVYSYTLLVDSTVTSMTVPLNITFTDTKGNTDPTGGINANSNSSNTNNNSGPKNNSTPNDQINTNTSFKLGDLDQSLGEFDNPLSVNSIPELIAVLIKILFFLTGLAAVIVIIIAGFRMVLAQGNESQLTNAKKAITWAVVGLIVSVLAFSIVAIIQSIIQTRL